MTEMLKQYGIFGVVALALGYFAKKIFEQVFSEYIAANRAAATRAENSERYVREELAKIVVATTRSMDASVDAIEKLNATLGMWAGARPCLLHKREHDVLKICNDHDQGKG